MVLTGGSNSFPPVSYFQLNPIRLAEIVLSEVEEDYRRHGRAVYGRDIGEIEYRVRQGILRDTGNFNSAQRETHLGELIRDSLGIVELNLCKIRSAQCRQIMGFDYDFKERSYSMIFARIKGHFLD